MDMPVEFACPACGAPIHTDREGLSAVGELVCPGCGRRVVLEPGTGPTLAEEASGPPSVGEPS